MVRSDYDGPELPQKTKPSTAKIIVFAFFIIAGLSLLAVSGIFITQEKDRVAHLKACNEINKKMLDQFGAMDGKLINVQDFCDDWSSYKDSNCPIEGASSIYTVNQFCG